MKLSQTKTSPSTRSVLKFDDCEVIDALKILARKQGYTISSNGKCFIWHPYSQTDDKTALVIDNIGDDFCIEN